MELVATFRVLWRRRLFLVPGLCAALAVAAFVATRPAEQSGFASLRVVLDTRPSQLVANTPEGVETLGWRAQLVTERLTDDASRKRVADDLGVPPEAVKLLDPDLQVPLHNTAIARTAIKEGLGAASLVATVSAVRQLGTIEIGAYAADPKTARRLAEAVAAALRVVASPSVAEAARTPTPTPTATPEPADPDAPPAYGLGSGRTDEIQGYTLTAAGGFSETLTESAGMAAAAAAGMFVFGAWMVLVLVVPPLLGSLRRSHRP